MKPAIRDCSINWRHDGVQHSTQRAPVSAELRSLLDLADRERVKDAKHQLDRCATDADFAAWARRWGEAFVAHSINRIRS